MVAAKLRKGDGRYGLKKMSAEAHTCVFSMLASGARLLQVLGQPTKTLTQRAKKIFGQERKLEFPTVRVTG